MTTNLAANIAFLLKKVNMSFQKLKNEVDIQAVSINEIRSISDLTVLSKFFSVSTDTLLFDNLQPKAKSNKVKILILDVDGVLTDAGMYYTESGDEFKKFNAKDGLAIKRLTKQGFQVAIASNGINKKLITSRAKLLGIQNVYVGVEKKEIQIEKWLKKLKIGWDNVAYIGDDINDTVLFQRAGLTACPADAVKEIRKMADVVLKLNGGYGCVREFIDEYLQL